MVRQQAAEIERLNAQAAECDRLHENRSAFECMDKAAQIFKRERDEARAHLSAIRERVEKLPRWDCWVRIDDGGMKPRNDGDYLHRSDVLSALGVVTESLTTEHRPVCSRCNDTHKIAED